VVDAQRYHGPRLKDVSTFGLRHGERLMSGPDLIILGPSAQFFLGPPKSKKSTERGWGEMLIIPKIFIC